MFPQLSRRAKASWRYFIFALRLWFGFVPFAVQAQIGLFSVSPNMVVEKEFVSTKAYADPFNEVELNVLVTTPTGEELRVPAFWAGGQKWKFRYSSPIPGRHPYRTECSDTNNSSLHGIKAASGIYVLKPSSVDMDDVKNPFYQHGAIRVAADKKHFEHLDGTPFLWLADTWWMGFCQRLIWPIEFKNLTTDRVKKGFNVVQIVAGLYPDMAAFDLRGANEAGFPWAANYATINPAYFDYADRRVQHLVDAGIAPCLVGAWGYYLPWLGAEKFKKHWRYLVARYGAYPAFWCIAGEGVMPFYLSKNREADSALQKRILTETAAYVRGLDPFHRPISIHPTDTARNQIENPALLDFDMLQTGHGDRASIPSTLQLVRSSRAAQPAMPTINSEVCYEGILDTCWEGVQRFMVWSCLLSGAAGHTYGANGIWQINEMGRPYGKSPAGNNWGDRSWVEAMNLPGSRQTGLAKQLLELYEWWKFAPHPEWVSLLKNEKPSLLAPAKWIWFPEGAPAQDAPVGKRFFRRDFVIYAGEKIEGAEVKIAADNQFQLFVNGQKAGEHTGWKPASAFAIGHLLRPDNNVLAVLVENVKSDVAANPAGLICRVEITLADGKTRVLASDERWRCAKEEATHWTSPDFYDETWAKATILGEEGVAPWGELGAGQEVVEPFAAGISGRVRIIYVPTHQRAVIHQLEAGKKYAAAFFNPETGGMHFLETVVADPQGAWPVPKLPTMRDAVLVLEVE